MNLFCVISVAIAYVQFNFVASTSTLFNHWKRFHLEMLIRIYLRKCLRKICVKPFSLPAFYFVKHFHVCQFLSRFPCIWIFIWDKPFEKFPPNKCLAIKLRSLGLAWSYHSLFYWYSRCYFTWTPNSNAAAEYRNLE